MSTGEPVDEQENSSSQSSSAEQVDELRADLTTKVGALLDVDEEKARKIVEAFDAQIARPVERKFAELQPHDLLKRNPYFYGVLGVTSSLACQPLCKESERTRRGWRAASWMPTAAPNDMPAT